MASETDKTKEGEGNKTAAGEYNQAQRRFVKSGKVQEKAREAARALDGPEADELAQAETVGKSRIAEEDPHVSRDRHERVRRRAHDIWEAEGRPHGRDREHWHQAETELKEP